MVNNEILRLVISFAALVAAIATSSVSDPSEAHQLLANLRSAVHSLNHVDSTELTADGGKAAATAAIDKIYRDAKEAEGKAKEAEGKAKAVKEDAERAKTLISQISSSSSSSGSSSSGSSSGSTTSGQPTPWSKGCKCVDKGDGDGGKAKVTKGSGWAERAHVAKKGASGAQSSCKMGGEGAKWCYVHPQTDQDGNAQGWDACTTEKVALIMDSEAGSRSKTVPQAAMWTDSLCCEENFEPNLRIRPEKGARGPIEIFTKTMPAKDNYENYRGCTRCKGTKTSPGGGVPCQ